jgi:hypothetical protein
MNPTSCDAPAPTSLFPSLTKGGAAVRVLLGNPAAKDAASGDPLDGDRVTTVHIPDTYTLLEAVATVTAPDGVWARHTQHQTPDDAGEGAAPAAVPAAWVESDHGGLAALLADHFGCKVGRPKGWKESVS